MRDLTEVKSWCQNTRIRGQRNRGPVAQTQAGSARFICFSCDKAGRSIAKHSFIDAVAKAMMPYSNCTLSSKESCNMWAYAKTSKGLIYICYVMCIHTRVYYEIFWHLLMLTQLPYASLHNFGFGSTASCDTTLSTHVCDVLEHTMRWLPAQLKH